MVPLGLLSARPMAQALRLPFEYYIYIFFFKDDYVYLQQNNDKLCMWSEVNLLQFMSTLQNVKLSGVIEG